MHVSHGNQTESQRKQHGILVAGHFDREYGYSIHRPAGDSAWFMTLTLGGRGTFRADEALHICEKGDVMVIPPGTPQHYATAHGGKWNFIWCHFLPPSRWNAMLHVMESGGKDGIIPIRLDDQKLQEVYGAFERVYKYRQSNIPLALNGLDEVLIRLSDMGSDNQQCLDPRINEVMAYMSEHLAESPSLSLLADKAHLSRSRLCHLFKEQVGESIIEVLTKMRLHHAVRLLEFTSINISEIAQEVGFRSAFYFTTRFTEYYGTNPSTFRKQKRAAHQLQKSPPQTDYPV